MDRQSVVAHAVRFSNPEFESEWRAFPRVAACNAQKHNTAALQTPQKRPAPRRICRRTAFATTGQHSVAKPPLRRDCEAPSAP
jgi:hypothetical protein